MNKVTFFEITYDDQSITNKFYQNVFGWQIIMSPDMKNHMAKTTTSSEKVHATEPGAINGE